ncbi:hypothetical protein CHS0354_030159 [Potamilus streckersoni]|uniref:Toll-like receptor n=1 Tax=Potamilus streckersoni TaxID=2493646 RepID=A0AAE0ST90_9BIVA|nr:hypothetical protein CHS0354_030159 [Potamilus streckersoni]
MEIVAVLLTILCLGCCNAQYWYAESYWNDRYGSKGIAYTQDDRQNGLWSDYPVSLMSSYRLLNTLYSIPTCAGCSCDPIKRTVTNCAGTVNLVQQFFHNISSETFHVGTISITILSCPDFKLIVDRTFENLTHLHTLNLAYNQIVTTSSNNKGWKLPSTITHIAMMGNKMYWIPTGWVSGPNLRIASFSYNQLTQLSYLVFGDVSSLVYLGLDGNKMTKLSKKSLEPLVAASKFVHLNISNNLLTFIEPGTFAQLPGLRILEIHQNSMSAIPVNTFSNISSLVHLDLNSNKLATLTSNSFQNLLNLTEFRLHSQKTPMTSIAFDAWSNIGNELQTLFVSSNNLRTFPHQVMSEGYYPKLNTIYADYNWISDVVEYGEEAFPQNQRSIYERKKSTFTPFSTYPALQTLYLSNNRITQIHSTDYCNLTSIISLYLSGNIIYDSIHLEAFACIRTLQFLYLDSNGIQYVPTAVKTNTSLPSIFTLSLSGNKLTFVDSGDFSNLTTLTTLYLSSNNILAIENGAFPPQLVTLTLGGNDFHFLHKHPFSNLTKLNHLDLSSNEIDYLPPDAFENCTSLQSIPWPQESIGSVPYKVKSHKTSEESQ